MRGSSILASAIALAGSACVFVAKAEAADPVAHGQTGKPAYRLGDRLFWRRQFPAGQASLADPGGRVAIRFKAPKDAQLGRHLSVGVEAGGRMAAVAQPLRLCAGIARLDFFPEGGAIVPGGLHRIGLLARALNGEGTGCE